MKQPDEFDAFYKESRDRLLAQTYALTGDLVASRRAVRDAFVVAWHRWRKLARLDGRAEAEAVVRPHAWRLAQRHHTARVLRRDRDLDPRVAATLEALGKLSVAQRKALVLTQLAAVSMPQMGREVGLPLEDAERELQSGAAALALALDVETAELRMRFEEVAAAAVAQSRWPRATIVRRAGASRRRAHTLVGVVGAVAAVVVTGALVTDAAGVRPQPYVAPQEPGATPTRPAGPPSEQIDVGEGAIALTDAALLDVPTVAPTLRRSLGDRAWTVARTTDNSAGNGRVMPCQLERYADPRGEAALVRVLSAAEGRRLPAAGVVQLAEASSSTRAAQRTYRTMVGWFAGCTEPRVQLLGTRTPQGLGDESVQLVLRSWADPVTTWVVGVARTGVFTTTTFLRVGDDETPDREAAATVLGAAVDELCALPDGGGCGPAGAPELVDRTPLPAGPAPALVGELDLPPLSRFDEPWVGTEARRPTTNPAATSCDETAFTGEVRGASFDRAATRTFLLPESGLPQEFGLSETVGALPPRAAAAFVDRVRERLESCADRDLNTDVESLGTRDVGPRGAEETVTLSAWRLEVAVDDERDLVFLMAVLRNGTAVGQLGYVPADGARLEAEVFLDLAERARDRLEALPPPRD
ncbi:hypothetical protein GCM10023340_21100 [Nocardioides marinquilinus]|uniref:DNA-directed RNA polymerase specialized sigma24 family protein n=1 Tax=Nocardioides marinquilinus TaxID=1210400 RepID=A0ABP9PL84_9ACTN